MTTRQRINFWGLFCVACLGLSLQVLWAQSSQAGKFKLPEIFLLGDSQFAFGAGPTFYDFFSNFADNCSAYTKDKWLVDHADALDVGVMGVRSTSIHSWVARNWGIKKYVCEPDPKWKVNARLYGWTNRTNGTYVQLGRAHDFKICKPKRSVLEVMLADPMERPKLLLMFFTGNSVHRWANGRTQTTNDMKKLVAQLPVGLPCIIMTTVPTYRSKDNRLRKRAQMGIQRAIAATGSRCTFVPGYTKQTIKSFQGSPRFYRRHASGKVKDPYHPNEIGARNFLQLRRKAICTAALKGLRPMALALRQRIRKASAGIKALGLRPGSGF